MVATEQVARAQVQYEVNFSQLEKSLAATERRVRTASGNMAKGLSAVDTAAIRTSAGFAGVGRVSNQMRASLQNAGFQLQDIIVSLQAGQDPLRVFVQQGSQLAGAFGPAGVAIGLVGAAVGALVPTLISYIGAGTDAVTTTTRLRDAVDKLDDILGSSSGDVRRLAEAYDELTEAQRSLIRLRALDAISEADAVLQRTKTEAGNLTEEFLGLARVSQTLFRQLSEGLFGADPIVPEGAFEPLRNVLEEFRGGNLTVDEFARSIGELTAQFPESAEALQQYEQSILDLGAAYADAQARQEQARTQLEVLDKSIETGGKSAEEYAEEIEKAGEALGRLTAQAALMRAEGARFEESLENAQELARARADLAESQAAAIAASAQPAQDQLEKIGRQAEDISRAVAASFADTFRSMAQNARDFDDVLADVLLRLADVIANIAVFQPFAQALSTGITGLFGTSGQSPGEQALLNQIELSAKGNVFSNRVVDSPHFFKFGSGGVGVMGEAGTEAVMPLVRLPSGDLGVRSSGGGETGGGVEININSPQAPVEVSQRQGPDGRTQIDVTVQSSLQRLGSRGALPGSMGANRSVR